VRLANAGSSKLKELQEHPGSGTPIWCLVGTIHEHGLTTKGMSCPAPGEQPVVETIILNDTITAKSDPACGARKKKGNVRERVWM
jgi:hypothetical protein